MAIKKDSMYYRFCLYGFLKNQRFFDPFIILFFREMGMSFLEIGTLFSIREIATNILEIPTGVIADAYGRRKSMIYAFISYIISFAIFYLFPRFYVYAIAMIFFASGEAFRSGTHKAMILEYLRIKGMKDKKVEYYGHTRSASQFGSAVSSLIAIAIVFYARSYRPVFLISIIPYIMGLILMFTYPAYLDGIQEEVKGRWKQRVTERFKRTMRDFLSMFKSVEALKAIFNSAIFDGFFKSSKDYLQPILKAQALLLPVLLYLGEKQRVAIIVGVVYFFLYILTSLASRNAGKVVSRIGSLTRAINNTFLLGGILLFISGLSTSLNIPSIAICSYILFYILQNMRRPMNVGYISDNIPSTTMASGLSVESQLKTISMAILAPIIGFLADKTGVGNALIIISIVFIALFIPLKVGKGRAETTG